METKRTYPYPTPVTILAWATIHGAAEDREVSGRELARIILGEPEPPPAVLRPCSCLGVPLSESQGPGGL